MDVPRRGRGKIFIFSSILMVLSVFIPPLGGETLFGDSIEETEGRGLVIRSEPAGARVFIDGIERGRTPLIMDTLPPGEYEVRLDKEAHRERRLKVFVRGGGRLVLSLVLEEARGRILLKVLRSAGSPPEEVLALNPRISVGGDAFPGPELELPPGLRNISVRAFGWEDENIAVYVREGGAEPVEIHMKPAPFRLGNAAARRKRFNPANTGSLGTTEIAFEVSAPGRARIDIFDPAGRPVFSAPLGPFETWSQSLLWNGRDGGGSILPDGIYLVRINGEALSPGDPDPQTSPGPPGSPAELAVEIDSSLVIRPSNLPGGIPGLLFAPGPETLPPGSFQLETALLFGRPPGTAGAWKTLPFAAALRFSPLGRLEFSTALNIIPEFRAAADWALGGTVKGSILPPGTQSGGIPLGLAAGLAWAWTGEAVPGPFGMDSGLKLFLPASWHFGEALSLVFSPAVLWSGPKGYPEEALPRLLLSGGLRFDRPALSAALSLRQDYEFTGPGIFMFGGEFRFFPPPSILVLSLSGGGWFKDAEKGAFGGLGIGLIY